MKLFFLGVLFGVGLAFITRHSSLVTFPNFKCFVYFALFAWLLWNVSALLRAKARKENRS